MNSSHRITLGMLCLAAALAFASSAGAQQKQPVIQQNNIPYSVSRETTLNGTVVSFSEGTSRGGAQLTLNTPSGMTTANVGNAKLLSLNGMTFNPDETVRLTGETITVAGSAFFAARIVQKGSQSLTVRSQRGFMAQPTRANVPASAFKQEGVL